MQKRIKEHANGRQVQKEVPCEGPGDNERGNEIERCHEETVARNALRSSGQVSCEGSELHDSRADCHRLAS